MLPRQPRNRPPKKKEEILTPYVVFQPATSRRMLRGIRTIVNAIRPTLGPLPRLVANETIGSKKPELMDDGGTIARRIIQLKDRDADVGAMFLRHVLWAVHEKVGDATATTALLFEAVFEGGYKHIINGGNAMALRIHLENGARLIMQELDKKIIPVNGKEQLAKIALSITYDPPLAKMMGEIVDIIGEYGQFDTRSGRGRELEREYVEGMYWDGGLISREMFTVQEEMKAVLEDAAILITDLKFDKPEVLAYFAEKAHKSGEKALVVMGLEFADSVKALMHSVNKSPLNFKIIGIKTPGMELSKQIAALEDIAILTGGQAMHRAAGQTPEGTTLNHLGHARRIWANLEFSGIVGGKGDPRALRKHVATLRYAVEHEDDPEIRKRLQWRLGKLMGGSATLILGGNTETEMEYRKEIANRTIEALRASLKEGVLPGGGTALLACKPLLLERMHATEDPEERAAYRILSCAVEAPFRTIVKNAGYNPDEVLADLKYAPQGSGFDVVSGQVVNVREAGILDVTSCQKTAVRTAIDSAALALTTDIIIHHKKPVETTTP